jgi:hypothetical protein
MVTHQDVDAYLQGYWAYLMGEWNPPDDGNVFYFRGWNEAFNEVQ